MTHSELQDLPAQDQEWPGSDEALRPRADHGAQSWTPRGRLSGKRALVTGGDSGIGRAIALTFAMEGADVMITHLAQEQADAAETLRLVREQDRVCVAREADLRSRATCVRTIDAAAAELGGLDVLVCNAAFQMTHDRFEDFPAGQLERVFETNLFSTFWLAQAACGVMRPGSAILVTTSIQAYSPSDHLLDYAASKAGLNNLVVNLAGELGPRGIRINAVAPGPIWTPLIPATMSPEKVRDFGSDTPLGRPGNPVEVAAAFVFLASDEASYVSGTVLGVTGGKPVF